MILFWRSIHFSDFFLEIMTELQKDIFTIWNFVSDNATLVIELSSKLCWFCCSSKTLQGISFHQFHLFFLWHLGKKLAWPNSYQRLFWKTWRLVCVTNVYMYKLYLCTLLSFFLGCFYMWLHVSTHLQGMLSNTNCGTLSFVRTVLSHACDWSA